MASDQALQQPEGADAPSGASGHPGSKLGFWPLVIGSLGVVYGDIGTSPLYAFKEIVALAREHDGIVNHDTVVGALSLILWALTLVVTFKYVMVLLRADNNGEGGTLTLVALAQRALAGRWRHPVLFLGAAGAALFFGDAMVTPAISVMSAVEGVKLITPALDPYIVTITIVILIGLFSVQNHGSGKMGALFGPIMALWFGSMGVLGLVQLVQNPSVLAALSPHYAFAFFWDHTALSLVVLGAVCLAVTGAEALYADMGHFGRTPIRSAWFAYVFPALALNYLGQGALVLADPSAAENPFFRLAPSWLLLPLVILATFSTIIASQSVITGAFSLTRQAIQLGLLPRLDIRFTSAEHSGQIFLPRINMILLVGVILLVAGFGSSSALAHAYGISVFGAMTVDTLLAIIVIWKGWRWSIWTTLALMLPFLAIDLAFVSANMLKLFTGAWVPLLLAAVLILLMWTWVKGSEILFAKTRKSEVRLAELVQMLSKSPPHRVKGTAVFLTSDPETAPSSMLHNLKHNKVLHEKNIILTIRSSDMPRVPENQRVYAEPLQDGFWRVDMTFGYMETPNVPRGLAIMRKQGLKFDIMSTSFFLSRRSIRPAADSGMPMWQDKLFIGLAKNASDATDFFQIPTGRVVEVGTQVTI